MIMKQYTSQKRFRLIPLGHAGFAIFIVAFSAGIFFNAMFPLNELIPLSKIQFPSIGHPISTPQLQQIDFNITFLASTKHDILNTKLPQFLPNFTNPCFYEWIKPTFSKSGLPRRRTTPVRVMRCLPFFMLIGQPKSGSTDLFYRITQHPDVVRPRRKENHWWTRRRHNRRTSSWQFYLSYFNAESIAESAINNKLQHQQKITGEGSVSTLWDHRWWWQYPVNKMDEEPKLLNAQYIYHFLPNVKLIVIMRNPVDRLYSGYLYFHKSNPSATKFHDYAKYQIETFQECLVSHSFRSCMYNTEQTSRLLIGVYAFYIAEWMKVFPREQFLFIRMEDYSRHIDTTMDKIYKFLNLCTNATSKLKYIMNARSPKNKRKGDMLDKTRKMLSDFYRPYNKQLAALLNDDGYLWKDTF